MSTIVPLGDRIVVKQAQQEEVRASGLVIPDTAKREAPAWRGCCRWTRPRRR